MPGDYLPLKTGPYVNQQSQRSYRKAIFGLVLVLVVSIIAINGWSPLQPLTIGGQDVSTHTTVPTETRAKRVAIIGAGASGCSAAFFLSRAAREAAAQGLESIQEIVVYESNGYVGGRSTTVYPHNDTSLRPIELGASIFVGPNKNLVHAVEYFNLSTNTFELGDGESGSTGIWDGSTFVFQTAPSDSFFSSIRTGAAALWRYGLSSWRTDRAVAALLKNFANLYNPAWTRLHGPSASIEDWAERSELGIAYTTEPGWSWAVDRVGVSKKWASEIIGASTRVNYASNLQDIHALGAAVSMATEDAKQVTGGNWQMFAKMLDASQATVRLGTEVTDIELIATDGDDVFAVTAGDEQLYDAVFFAAPWHLSSVAKSLHVNMTETIPQQQYVHLHVTLVTTRRPHFDPAFFGLSPGTIPPTTVLTASDPDASHPPSFFSANYQGKTSEHSNEYVVKIFSLAPIDDYFLNTLFGEEPTWVLRKEWDSYPALRPTASYAPVEPIANFHYLAAMESWVSTMETQTLSAREAVGRVAAKWWGLGMGQCGGDGKGWDWTCWE